MNWSNYDAWKTSTPEDYEPESPADYGWIHEDDVPDLDACRGFIEVLIKSVYEVGNIEILEDALDELAAQFDVKMPDNDTQPILEKKGSVRTDRTLESWLQFNQGYNECLRNQATR